MNMYMMKSAAAMAMVGMLTVSLPVQAALMDTETVIEQTVQSAASVQQRLDVSTFLTRADVQQQMQTLGVSPQQAMERVAALSDNEIAKLHADLPDAAAGGDIFGVLIFVFVVLLITDILGLTKVFPFTRSMHR